MSARRCSTSSPWARSQVGGLHAGPRGGRIGRRPRQAPAVEAEDEPDDADAEAAEDDQQDHDHQQAQVEALLALSRLGAGSVPPGGYGEARPRWRAVGGQGTARPGWDGDGTCSPVSVRAAPGSGGRRPVGLGRLARVVDHVVMMPLPALGRRRRSADRRAEGLGDLPGHRRRGRPVRAGRASRA